MLRQVFLYFNNEVIFTHYFAQAYNNDTLNIVLTKNIASYISNPAEGQVFSKPLFEFQAHFGMFKGVFFLFVTDMADRPKVIQSEIQRAAKLYAKNFPNPTDIKGDSQEKQEFTTFIQETHYYLHPKLALMGSTGAGKTSITNFLKTTELPEKKIMNFGEYYRIKVGDLYFDLWDYIDHDDFSPLWNKFVSGTDLLFFVVDGANISDQKVQFYVNLKRREAKYSSWVVIVTHEDIPGCISPEDLKNKFQLGDIKAFSINLTAPDAKSQLLNIFNEAIGLKKPLPPEFRSKLVEANSLVSKEEYGAAINLLTELLSICREYNEFTYLGVFEKKIEELKEKNAQKKIRDEEEKAKIKAPEKIQFKTFSMPKAIPIGDAKTTQINAPSGLPSLKPLPTPPKPQATANIPQITPISKNYPIEVQETQKPSESKFDGGLDTSLAADIQAANPFFGGLKPSKPTLTPKENIEPIISEERAKEIKADSLQIKFRPELQKVQPIDLPDIKSTGAQYAENLLEKSLSLMKEGVSPEKTLTFERSPLVSQTPLEMKNDIEKTKPVSPPIQLNPLAAFTLNTNIQNVSPEAEKLGEAIRDLGESLSRELCQKFIEQLKIRMKKTNLTDQDIENAAHLYVEQRRKKMG